MTSQLKIIPALLAALFCLSCGCGVEDRIASEVERAVAAERERIEAEVREAALEELRAELREQSSRLMGLMVRYSDALQRLVIELSKEILRTACVVVTTSQNGNTEYIIDRGCAQKELEYDGVTSLLHVAELLQERLKELFASLGRGASQDLKAIQSCKSVDVATCDITPLQIVTELKSLYPSNHNFSLMIDEFTSIRDEVRQMLGETYWREIADQRTRNVIRRVFGG